MTSIILNNESHWDIQKDDDASMTFGEGLAGAVSLGEIRLSDPKALPYALQFSGAGAGVGLGIKIPMKIPFSKLFGLSVKGFTRKKRAVINFVEEKTEFFSKAKDLAGVSKGVTDRAVPSAKNDDESSESDTAAGIIFVGSGCSQDDLAPTDFNGCYIMLKGDLGIFEGLSGTMMLAGLKKLPRPRVPVDVAGTPSWMSSLEYLAMVNFPELALASLLVDVLAETKAVLLFAEANVDLRMGGSMILSTGYATCSERG